MLMRCLVFETGTVALVFSPALRHLPTLLHAISLVILGRRIIPFYLGEAQALTGAGTAETRLQYHEITLSEGRTPSLDSRAFNSGCSHQHAMVTICLVAVLVVSKRQSTRF